MELTILGSGCGIPSLERGAPGILIKIDNQPLLFDSGPGTLVRLLETGVDYKSIEHVLKTHTPDLMSIPEVIGTAQGLCEGLPCIKIFVVKMRAIAIKK